MTLPPFPKAPPLIPSRWELGFPHELQVGRHKHPDHSSSPYNIAFKYHLNPYTICIISLKRIIISKLVLYSSLYLQHLLQFGDPNIC